MLGSKLYLFGIIFITLVAWIDAESDYYLCKIETYDASLKGTISSPLYGKLSYPISVNCKYKIKAPLGQMIKITFKDFDLYPSKYCYHRLVITGKEGRIIVVLCGNQLPRPILSDEGEDLKLEFYTDFYGSGRGFLLEYESGPDLQLCETGESACANRNCFKPEKKCDGVDDCGDGTDEENCNFPVVVFPRNCGVQIIKPKEGYDRLIGGEEATPNSWPWQVSLSNAKIEPIGHFCGGTLINSLWVLTAAHCIARRYAAMNIIVGAHNLGNTTSYQQTRRSVKVIAFPELKGEKIKDYRVDLALVKMNAPITFNAGVQPACLPDFSFKPPVHWQCYVTGWGETRGSGFSNSLKQLLVEVRPDEDCKGMYEKGTGVCVWKAKQGVCHGDSGGPVQCQVAEKYYVFGASSAFYSSFVSKWDDTSRCAGMLSQGGYAGTHGRIKWIKYIIEKYT
ncbi:chymotrypsin-like elastase family member 2A [Argiope bruennichi]|uniref:chymotrypsin-like elastase family member 2A n=1 Tax=Argiope bruennichi TaxID=94029 RepID=UPI0024951D6E|nr:chymotrypsin-like elastase family member 2A [Argiope bruennichi]